MDVPAVRRVLLATLVTVLLLASPAAARPIDLPPAPSVTTSVSPPPSTLSTPAAPEGGVLSAPDTTLAIGGEDASCSHLQNASATVVRNCKASGLAESAFPPGNFGADTHVNTGFTQPANDFYSVLQHLFGGVFGLFAQLLTWMLLGLGLAFGFDLFASDKHGTVAHGLNQADQLFTSPLLGIFLVIGGVVGVVYWVGQRAEGRALAHWGMMTLMIIFALIIMANPVGVFGWLDQASNVVASGALSAFNGQSDSPANGFADAAPAMYKTAMEEPWCAVEFGNVSWCMAPVDAKMAAARQSTLQHLDQALGDQGTPQLAAAEAPAERTRLNDAQTNGELFLAFPPNANARNGQNDNWTLYHALINDHAELTAIRASGGVWQRAFQITFAAFAGLAFLLLVGYITFQLIVASFMFLIGLLMTPIAIFLPAFGQGGQAKFIKWLAMLIEALFKKVIFAVYLGVILAVTRLFLGFANTNPLLSGWGMQWICLFVLWVAAFAYRHRYLAIVSGGLYESHAHPGGYARRFGTVAAATYLWKRTPQKTQAVYQHDHYTGDTVHQHVHVNGYDRPEPRRVPSVNGELEAPDTIPGELHE